MPQPHDAFKAYHQRASPIHVQTVQHDTTGSCYKLMLTIADMIVLRWAGLTWIWLLRGVPKVGSLTGMMTISLLLASTRLFNPAGRILTLCLRGETTGCLMPPKTSVFTCLTIARSTHGQPPGSGPVHDTIQAYS